MMPVPAVADREEDAGVVAGIVIVETGGRMMDAIRSESEGLVGAAGPVHPRGNLRREVDGGGVARRNVGSGEQGSAGDVDVGEARARLGEVPTKDDGFDAGAVY